MKFSLPLNPFLSREESADVYIPFLRKHRELIEDFYFTCRIAPFDGGDSMGAVISGEADREILIKQALFVQSESGVPANAVFNSLAVSPATENLGRFIENFRPLYQAGVRRITMINAHWAGTIKHHFPEAYLKSSVVRPPANAQNFVDYGLYGFDCVIVDRNLMRDREELERVARAREFLRESHGRSVDICMLANEQCRGLCPVQHEHHLYNALRSDAETQPAYMTSSLSSISCNGWRRNDPAYRLKICDMPPYKNEYDELLKYVQSFKLHGRDDVPTLNASMRLIKNYAAGLPVLDETQAAFLEAQGVRGERLKLWLERTRTCRNQCWQCNLCDTLVGVGQIGEQSGQQPTEEVVTQ